jgi:RES domain-containing protein
LAVRHVRPDAVEGVWLQLETYASPDTEFELPDAEARGGRFNPPGRCPILYMAKDSPLCRGAAITWCGPFAPGCERVVLLYRVTLSRVLNLCDPKVRYALGVTLEDLVGEDLSVPRSLGVAAFQEELEGILYPRPATAHEVNLGVFRGQVGVQDIAVVGRIT